MKAALSAVVVITEFEIELQQRHDVSRQKNLRSNRPWIPKTYRDRKTISIAHFPLAFLQKKVPPRTPVTTPTAARSRSPSPRWRPSRGSCANARNTWGLTYPSMPTLRCSSILTPTNMAPSLILTVWWVKISAGLLLRGCHLFMMKTKGFSSCSWRKVIKDKVDSLYLCIQSASKSICAILYNRRIFC